MEGANRNIEIKCRCDDLEGVRQKALALGAVEKGVLVQEDTFFKASYARLKLRVIEGGRAELISYRRPDITGSRGCDYVVCRVEDPRLLKETLAHALESDGMVRKRRRLLIWKDTRIHLDEVDGLGSFVELETVLSGRADREGREEMEEVAKGLGIAPTSAVPVPYLDLLKRSSV
jgi:predicted adenylyl cyclase CyaB